MEQTPLERANQEQSNYQKVDQVAEAMRNNIDKNILGLNTNDYCILGININSYLRSFSGSYYSRCRKSQLLTEQEIIEEVNTITSYIPKNVDCVSVLPLLQQKHSLFAYVINRLVVNEVDRLNLVSGPTIDHIYNEKRVIPGLSEPISNFVRKQALNAYYSKKHNGETFLPVMNFNGEKDIHFAPLFGHSRALDLKGGELLISSDSKYVRAYDNPKEIIWSVDNGNQVDSIDIPKNIVWTRGSGENYLCKQQRVIDRDGKCFVTPGMAPAFGSYSFHNIQYQVEKKYSFPVIMLFVRPTIQSQLCQDAFICSKGNKEELKALQESQSVAQLKGLPAANLKHLIKEELDNLHTQARL